MKKNLVDEAHCPHCKRQCPLSNPHCKKGRVLAAEKKKELKKSKEEEMKEEEMKEEEIIETEIVEGKMKEGKIKKEKKANIEFSIEPPSETNSILLHLFQDCSQALPVQSDEKISNKMKKVHITSILADKGELTKQEMVEYSELTSDELDKILSKLENKDYISWNQVDSEEKKVSLTKDGVKFANEHVYEERKDNLDPFSILDEEEKGNLKTLLKKLKKEWSK